MTINSVELIPTTPQSQPLGTCNLPEAQARVDLVAAGYVEQEYLVSGSAPQWRYDAAGIARPSAARLDYTTRILLRHPADTARFNGVLQAEPLHPSMDAALTWRAVHPWILRTGAAWVGITQDARSATSMCEQFDPERYGRLSIPDESLRYDIAGDIAAALRDESSLLGSLLPAISRAFLSGWSMTGTFCRVFVGDGFHDRHRRSDGAPVFDGYVIGISSGGAGRSGYHPLAADSMVLPSDDPRRTIGAHDVPVIELLSECESETQRPCLRPDSDLPSDRYRLYQVAGTSHDSTGPRDMLTNAEQYRRRALPTMTRAINEEPSDGRLDFVARAVYALLDRWVARGIAPPHAERFEYASAPLAAEHLPENAEPLLRDERGNVLGGIRTPWVEAPVARYLPHSTPQPGYCEPSSDGPMFSPAQVAALMGNMLVFDTETLAKLYPSPAHYVERFCRSCCDLVEQGFLLGDEAVALIGTALHRSSDLAS